MLTTKPAMLIHQTGALPDLVITFSSSYKANPRLMATKMEKAQLPNKMPAMSKAIKIAAYRERMAKLLFHFAFADSSGEASFSETPVWGAGITLFWSVNKITSLRFVLLRYDFILADSRSTKTRERLHLSSSPR